MKKLFIIAALFSITLYACNGKKLKTNTKDGLAASVVDTIKPKVNYRVRKKYDKNGNLISVDSTYSYIYSNGNISKKMQNKIFEQFKSNMSQQLPSMQNYLFDNFFENGDLNDSIFKNNFYSPNFFFRNQGKEMEKMLKRMDSIKNSFYKAQLKKFKKQV